MVVAPDAAGAPAAGGGSAAGWTPPAEGGERRASTVSNVASNAMVVKRAANRIKRAAPSRGAQPRLGSAVKNAAAVEIQRVTRGNTVRNLLLGAVVGAAGATPAAGAPASAPLTQSA